MVSHSLFIGLDDDLLGVPNTLEVGTVDALTNANVIPASDFEFSFATPASLTAAVTEANTFYFLHGRQHPRDRDR
jgi:hypothetical protein